MSTIWTYDALSSLVPGENRVLLGEGNTPLVASKFVGASLGLKNLYFKLENLNPTGSYKDRFASVLVSEMVRDNHKACMATSSGNTGAALAAYCAAAGIQCLIVVVEGAPMPKLRQMQLYGAELVMVKGFGKDPTVTQRVFDRMEEICHDRKIPLPISAYRYCSSAMQGVETIATELVAQDEEVRHIFVPAGGGGLTLAIAKGVMSTGKSVRVHCVQPEGNDTIASALRDKKNHAKTVARSTTAISGLQVANVLDGDLVIDHCSRLQGNGYLVRDESVFQWHKIMAQKEGIFCEPAGAVALAGLADAVARGEVAADETVVCLVTGSGFKDMPAVENNFNMPEVQLFEPAAAIEILVATK